MPALNYKNAFKCHKCPGTADANGCPVWWEDTWENEATGQIEVLRGCGMALMPRYLKWSAGRSALAAHTAQAARNDFARATGTLARVAQALAAPTHPTALLGESHADAGPPEG